MPDKEPGATRTSSALERLKGHGTLYTILCTTAAVLGMYLDFNSDLKQVEEETTQVESKAGDAENERVKQDVALQDNMQLLLELLVATENRLATLEEQVKQLEKDNSSFWGVFLNRPADTTEPSDPEHSDSDSGANDTHSTSSGDIKSSDADNYEADGFPDIEDVFPEDVPPISDGPKLDFPEAVMVFD